MNDEGILRLTNDGIREAWRLQGRRSGWGTRREEPGRRTGESQKQRRIRGIGCSPALLASTRSPGRRLCQASPSHDVHMREERVRRFLGSAPREGGLVLDAREQRALLDALEAGEIDVVMSGLSRTPDRASRVQFIEPYITVSVKGELH